ncbi:MAG: c-type cytochrome [Deltaproteobacteria bacterium]|nr:c-type cytochrome [Deltaproteobacteria bacterium]
MTMTAQSSVRHASLTLAPTLLFLVWTPTVAVAQPSAGAAKFSRICGACHTIGGGRKVGPDLQGVFGRRTEEWVNRFVRSPQKMISSGDATAVQLQKQFGMVMPDPPVSPDEVAEILAYVKTGGGPSGAQPRERPATPEAIQEGRELFQGNRRFTNGGPACNSCHHVKNDAVIGGGVLAAELTTVFGRMGAPGIHAILGRPPFPVMEEAFRERPLTDDEVFALVSFLQDADRQQAFQQPRDYGFKLVYSGAAGFLVLMGMFWAFGRRRKRRPVNHAIFERQVKTQ